MQARTKSVTFTTRIPASKTPLTMEASMIKTVGSSHYIAEAQGVLPDRTRISVVVERDEESQKFFGMLRAGKKREVKTTRSYRTAQRAFAAVLRNELETPFQAFA